MQRVCYYKSICEDSSALQAKFRYEKRVWNFHFFSTLPPFKHKSIIWCQALALLSRRYALHAEFQLNINAVDVMMPGIVRKNISVKIGRFISERHAYVVMGRRWLQISERNLRFLFGFSGNLMVAESSMMNIWWWAENFVGMTIGQVICQVSTDHYDSQESDVRLWQICHHMTGL